MCGENSIIGRYVPISLKHILIHLNPCLISPSDLGWRMETMVKVVSSSILNF